MEFIEIIALITLVIVFIWGLTQLDQGNDSFPDPVDFEKDDVASNPTLPKPTKSMASKPKKKRKEVKRPNRKERSKVYKRVQKVYKKRGYTMTMRETEDFFDEYLLVLGVMWLASLPRGDEAFYNDMQENVDVSEYGSEIEDTDTIESSSDVIESSSVDYSDNSNSYSSSDAGDFGGDD